jgi:DNA polymerase
MPVAGRGHRKILVIGEAPGATEDRDGKPFVGDAGQLLQQTLHRIGIDLFRDCWVTNAASCRPENNILPERAIGHCRPLILRYVEELRPRVVILLGSSAVKSIIGHLWREKTDGVKKWAGFQIPLRRWNCWVCPTYHPSHILRLRDGPDDPVTRSWFFDHLRDATALDSRPWNPVPDYESRIRVLTSEEAAGEIKSLPTKTPIAFDYETTCLRPHGPHAEIVSCSVSAGRMAFAFPWHGPAVREMKELLSDVGVPKVGWNVKMEEVWSRVKLGVRVRGWIADGMLQAHGIDCRTGITGLKFQVFARLGVEDYARNVEPYLKAKPRGGNNPNRILELMRDDPHRLLTYNAYDSLFEWMICRMQSREIGR